MEGARELKEINDELKEIENQIAVLLERQQYLEERKNEIQTSLSVSNEEPTSKQDFNVTNFPWSSELDDAREKIFKMEKFRPLQLECMNATMSGCDCVLIMPTGGGKSLCFQLPAVISKGLTLVVSPLVSLMEDQLMALERLQIKSEMLSASSSREKVNCVHAAMLDKKSGLKILYVTPEKIAKSKRFMAKLEKCYDAGCLSRIVIDEVHCTSQWGHDFRPDYKILGILKRQYPGVPILGLTATATTKVIEDVKKILNLKQDCLLLKASFNRPNLFYEVRYKPPSSKDCMDDICNLISSKFPAQSGIIYCLSRNDSEDIAKELVSRGIKASCYHADLPPEHRSQIHLQWTKNRIQVVVATVAFGMGIDKPDVRFVIHHTLSKSMENYYQESGRAGRDDGQSSCILYYRPFDAFRQLPMVFTEQTGLQNLYNILRYCQEEKTCRRAVIGQYFGEQWDPLHCQSMCDHCMEKTGENIAKAESIDITNYTLSLIKILTQAVSLDERITPNKLVEAWKGKGPTVLRVKDTTPPKLTQDQCERLIVHLLLKGFIKEEFHFTPYSTISYVVKGTRADMVTRGLRVKMDLRETNSEKSKRKSTVSDATPKGDTSISNGLATSSSSKRKRKANATVTTKKSKKAYVIESDSDEDIHLIL